MSIKNTILSQRDLDILEAVVVQYGKIVSFDQLQKIVEETVSRGAVRKRVAQMSKAGWLIRLKKGLYLVVTDIGTLGFSDISEQVIAKALNNDSYVSFESALQYYGMFDQMLARIDSVTTQTARTYTVLQTKYAFSRIKKDLYFGFTEVIINNQNVKIADKEKALLDMLYFRSSSYSASLVLEKLKDYTDQFDFEKLKAYSRKYSLGVVRKVGFLLDQIGIDTTDLLEHEYVKKNSYNKLSQGATQFNAKWRIYYDTHLIG